MIKLVRNKYFIGTIVVMSILGALYVGLFMKGDYDYVEKSRERFICLPDKKGFDHITTILEVDDSSEVSDYLDFVKENTTKINFQFGSVSEDQRIYWVRDHEKYNLSEIIAVREEHSLGQPGIERFWIWSYYLIPAPCQSFYIDQ